MNRYILLVTFSLLLLLGCVTNPETGEREFNWRWFQGVGEKIQDNAHKAPPIFDILLYVGGGVITLVGGGMASKKGYEKLRNSESGKLLGPTDKQLKCAVENVDKRKDK